MGSARAFVLVALVGILGAYVAASASHLHDDPIGTHDMRQVISPSAARLYAEGQPFLYPRVEACGSEPGRYINLEFPLYAWIMGKVGAVIGIPFAGRLLAMASTLGLMLALAGIAAWMFETWSPPARAGAALAAAAVVAASPLTRFYGISFVPDPEGHGWTLIGAALFAAPWRSPTWKPMGLGRFALGGSLMTLGVLTKALAAPHCVLGGLLLLDRARPVSEKAGFRSKRPWILAAVLTAVVLVTLWWWYRVWQHVLDGGHCEMVWVPKFDPNWLGATIRDGSWRSTNAERISNQLLGPLWFVYLAGLPLSVLARWRGAVFLVWAASCGVSFLLTGWHSNAHDYDTLVLLPPLAVAFGCVVACLVALGGRLINRRFPSWSTGAGVAAVSVAVVVLLALLGPVAKARSERHWHKLPGLEETARALDMVLPANEGIHYFPSHIDPRPPYFAHRRGLGSEWGEYCRQQNLKYDCCLEIDTNEKLYSCDERGVSVGWGDRLLTCGVSDPDSPRAEPRLIETIAKKVRFPADREVKRTLRYLGSDPVTSEGKKYLDLYLVTEKEKPSVVLLADGKPIALRPSADKWPAFMIIVARAQVLDPEPRKFELRVDKETIPVRYQ